MNEGRVGWRVVGIHVGKVSRNEKKVGLDSDIFAGKSRANKAEQKMVHQHLELVVLKGFLIS